MGEFSRRRLTEDGRGSSPSEAGGEPPTPAFRLPKGVGWVVLALVAGAVLAFAPRLIPFGYLAASNERARLESLARADKAQEVRPGLRPAWTDRCGREGLAAMRGGPTVNRATGLNSFDDMMICRLDEAAPHLCSPALREQLAAHLGVYFLGYLGTASSKSQTFDELRDFMPEESPDLTSDQPRDFTLLFPAAVKTRLRDLASKGLLDADDLKLGALAPIKRAFRQIVAGVRVTPTCKT